ncbi:MAG: RsmD family RNA methyltransferase [Ignavibacteria bacterium]|nr:RsmD family RNA methyltransferase [Ignavibacteria bacterium]
MRVISGFLKSRIITVPSGAKNIRPTTDKSRETIFNIISNRFNFEGKTVLDLFCGSGSFGIECISRGAEKVYFVDRNSNIAKKNIEELDITKSSVIVKTGVVDFLKANKGTDFYLTFADPPYDYRGYLNLVKNAAGYRNIFILEHSDNYEPDETYSEYIILVKETGSTKFTFFNFADYKYEEENNGNLSRDI